MIHRKENAMKLRREKSFLLWAGVCALAVFAPACGSDGNGDGSQALCVVEELEAGAYSFSLQRVDDACANGLLEPIIGAQPGPYGPVALPSFVELQQRPVSVELELPFVGSVTVQLSLEGDVIALSVPQGDFTFEGCVATVSASGTLCPFSQSEVGLTVALRLHNLGTGCGAFTPWIEDLPCTITVGLSGVQQPG
jgi:hypothetical protein